MRELKIRVPVPGSCRLIASGGTMGLEERGEVSSSSALLQVRRQRRITRSCAVLTTVSMRGEVMSRES